MRRGVRLGIDVGDVRVGVARSDPSGLLASPVEVVRAGDLGRIVALAAEDDVFEIVLGLPRGLSGREGPAAEKARAYADRLTARLPAHIAIRLVDERLSTVSAHQAYRSLGQSTRRTRGRVDAAAAAVILQSALDTERATNVPPGEIVARDAGGPPEHEENQSR